LDQTFILLALVVLLSYTVHALSGFGSLLIAITLGMHLYPADELLPILVPLDVLLNLYFVIRYRHLIERKFLVRRILPFMGIGVLIGILLFNYLHNNIIKFMYACFVLVVSVRELYLLYRKKQDNRTLSRVEEALWLLAGGLIKGVFGSGGPPVVYVAGRIISNKSNFRSTLAAVWAVLNTVLTVSYVVTGKLTLFTISRSAILFPVVILCVILGERFHTMVDEYKFKLIVFSLLLCAGISLFIR
jgi:uncharacterized protein